MMSSRPASHTATYDGKTPPPPPPDDDDDEGATRAMRAYTTADADRRAALGRIIARLAV